MSGMTPISGASQALIRPMQSTGLLPTPNSYQNYANNPQMIGSLRHYPPPQPLIPAPNRGLLPLPNSGQSLIQQSVASLPHQPQQNSSISYNSKPPVSQTTTFTDFSIPQPIPPPVPLPVPPPPSIQNVSQPPPPPRPPPAQQLNNFIPVDTQSQLESERIAQQKLETKRIEKLNCEGMENRAQNDLNGFYCLFCEVFCNNVVAAERHVETPKHHRVSHFL